MNHVNYTKYVIATGEVVGCGRCTDEENAYLQEDEAHAVVLGLIVNDEMTYIVDGEPTSRPLHGIAETYDLSANGEDILSIDIPDGSEVHFQDEFHSVADPFEFRTDTPGDYVFHLFPPFPYVQHVFTVRAR